MRKCEHAKIINADALQEIYEDISGEFGTLGKLVDSFIVKKDKATSGGTHIKNLL